MFASLQSRLSASVPRERLAGVAEEENTGRATTKDAVAAVVVVVVTALWQLPVTMSAPSVVP
jgi:hypothetical protein